MPPTVVINPGQILAIFTDSALDDAIFYLTNASLKLYSYLQRYQNFKNKYLSIQKLKHR